MTNRERCIRINGKFENRISVTAINRRRTKALSAKTNLRVSVNGRGVRIGLVAPGCSGVDVSHHGAVAAGQHAGSERLLELLFLLAVFRPSVLKPYLQKIYITLFSTFTYQMLSCMLIMIGCFFRFSKVLKII